MLTIAHSVSTEIIKGNLLQNDGTYHLLSHRARRRYASLSPHCATQSRVTVTTVTRVCVRVPSGGKRVTLLA